jgi:hypothetical protein
MCSNFATRMQEARLPNNRFFLFLFYSVSVPRVKVFEVSTNKGFPRDIALIYVRGQTIILIPISQGTN